MECTEQGCHGQGKVRENKILFMVGEKSGSIVSGQGISKSLFKVGEFYPEVSRKTWILLQQMFLYRQNNSVLKLCEPSLFLLSYE